MTDPEAVVREVFHLLEADQTDAAIALMDPGIEWRNTGLPTYRGPKVHEIFRDLARRGIGIRVDVHHIAADGDVVLTDRTDSLTYRRWTSTFWVRGTFVVRDGRVVLWDDAFGWGNFMAASLLGLARALRPG